MLSRQFSLVEKPASQVKPLMHASYNIKQMCKHLILLTEHLTVDEMLCFNCINKHLLTVSAYATEALSLERGFKYATMLNETINATERMTYVFLKQGDDLKTRHALAQVSRKIRSDLQPYANDYMVDSSWKF